jgi:hypothetical protein
VLHCKTDLGVNHYTTTTMSPLPGTIQQDFNALLNFPIKVCVATTVSTYVLSLVTGNVSQVDRVWTFMPTVYTAYWALLPLWRHGSPDFWGYLLPHVPEEAAHFAREFSPRASLMLGLTVRNIIALSIPLTPDLTDIWI